MQDKWGVMPLMAACWKGHIITAKILVENGAVIDLRNKVMYDSTIGIVSDSIKIQQYEIIIIGGPDTTLCR